MRRKTNNFYKQGMIMPNSTPTFNGRALRTFERTSNIYETIDKNTIVKVLKIKNSNNERVARFRQEVEILKRFIKEKSVDNITSIVSADFNQKTLMYEMKKYNGNATDDKLLKLTKGNVEKTISLILPVIETLQKLAAKHFIFHRDLKPENLLFEEQNGGLRFILADFGCAYCDDLTVQNRITSDRRSVGAMAYRAPEYQHGRVDAVDESGDIFSIGKLLWYFVNGIKGEVFPYTLWFPSTYNLTSEERCGGVRNIGRLNLIIASSVHYDPQKRISYENLLNSLRSIITDKFEDNQMNMLALLQHEQRDALKIEEEVAIGESLVNTVFYDIKNILEEFSKKYPESTTLMDLRNNFHFAANPLKSSLLSFIKSTGRGTCVACACPMRAFQNFELSIQHERRGNELPYLQFNCKAANGFGGIYFIKIKNKVLFIEGDPIRDGKEPKPPVSTYYSKSILAEIIQTVVKYSVV